MTLFDTQKKKVTLLLDIGNGSVAVALAYIATDGAQPEVVRYIREPLSPQTKPTGAELQIALIKTLKDTLQTFLEQEKGTNKKPLIKLRDATSILCTLSSPWFFSKGKTVSISQDKSFVMTERFLADVLSKEVGLFTEEIGTADDLHIVEKTILGATVNGYHLLSPLHQRTCACDIYIYMSAANARLIDQIMTTVGMFSHLSHEHVRFHSFPLVAFSVIRDKFPTVHEYLLFDIAGEITDIAWVSGGMIVKTVSYPCGTHLLVRQIAKHFDVPYEVGRSYLRLFLDERATKVMTDDIRALLVGSGKEFNIYLEEALKTLSPELALPHHIFVSTYPHALEVFTEFLKQDSGSRMSTWRDHLVVTYLGEEAIQKSEDAFLSLEAVFLSKFL